MADVKKPAFARFEAAADAAPQDKGAPEALSAPEFTYTLYAHEPANGVLWFALSLPPWSLPAGSYNYFLSTSDNTAIFGFDYQGMYSAPNTGAFIASHPENYSLVWFEIGADSADVGETFYIDWSVTGITDVGAMFVDHWIRWVVTIDPTAPTNTFTGGSGNDTYTSRHGDNYMNGGGGINTLNYAASIAAVTVSLATGIASNGFGAGRDTFVSFNNATGSAFSDTLTGDSVANTLTGADGGDTLNGGAGNDKLRGGNGMDLLNGGAGHDALNGGAGQDKFVFNAPAVGANSDTIADFTHLSDKIQFENSVFTALGAATGLLGAAKFWSNTTGDAHDADDRIIYNTVTGQLYYDSDGDAVAHAKVLIATLTGHPTLTAGDIVVI